MVLRGADDHEIFFRPFGNRPLPRRLGPHGGDLRQPRDRPHACGRQFDPPLRPNQHRWLCAIPREVVPGQRGAVHECEHEFGPALGTCRLFGRASHRPDSIAGQCHFVSAAAGLVDKMDTRGIDSCEQASRQAAVPLLYLDGERGNRRNVRRPHRDHHRPERHDQPEECDHPHGQHYRFSSPDASRLKYCSIASR